MHWILKLSAGREGAKQSWMEELGSSQSGCTRKKVHNTESVGQTAWRPYAPTGAMRLDDDEGNVRETSIQLGHPLGPQHRQSALSALTGYSAQILRRILSKRQAHLSNLITWKNTEVLDFRHCRRTPLRWINEWGTANLEGGGLF